MGRRHEIARVRSDDAIEQLAEWTDELEVQTLARLDAQDKKLTWILLTLLGVFTSTTGAVIMLLITTATGQSG
jgi:hypothetical protein